MKRLILAASSAVLMFTSCVKEMSAPEKMTGDLYAQIDQEDQTRTMMDENNNIRWMEGDQIVAFMKTSLGLKYQLKEGYAGKTYGSFSKVSTGSGDDLDAGTEWDHIVAYYPYSEGIECEKSDDDYVIDVVLPSEQSYVAASFGNGAFPMVSVSEDNDITFRNVCGGMKLQLKGTQNVVSINLQGKNNEKLSGAATVTAYTDETKPAIVMSDAASTSVTLNCGAGIQLNESTVTEFIIALPPVLFSQGFAVTVTDDAGKNYTVDTDKANTVLRSSLLVMPSLKLSETPDVEGDDDATYVETLLIDKSSLTVPPGFSYTFETEIDPVDVTDATLTWSSSNSSVATVDQTGKITAVSDGTATITVVAVGGVSAECSVTVKSCVDATVDYVDEYGVNHGKGISIGDMVWAPVNCGYRAATADDKGYPLGKHYQWGRKYGQGHDGDSTYPSRDNLVEGPVMPSVGNSEDNKDKFFFVPQTLLDWSEIQNDALWNSGTEDNPVKTDNDPCPDGWRVPTRSELVQLVQNHSGWISDEKGCYFSGDYTYIDGVPQIFLPASGDRYYSDGGLGSVGYVGCYWSVTPYSYYAYNLFFINDGYVDPSTRGIRASGYAVRCLQESN